MPRHLAPARNAALERSWQTEVRQSLAMPMMTRQFPTAPVNTVTTRRSWELTHAQSCSMRARVASGAIRNLMTGISACAKATMVKMMLLCLSSRLFSS